MLCVLKKNWRFVLFTICAGLVAGYTLGIWMYGQLTPEQLEQMQGMSAATAAALTALQTGCLYGGLLCAIGLWLAQKAGYLRPFTLQKKSVLLAMGLGSLVGLLVFPLDGLVFGRWTILASWSHLQAASLAEWLSSILYGGVIEEIMLRLFLLSLIAWLLKLVFARKAKTAPSWIGWAANITAALLFAAGHLPVTAASTILTPVVVIRCFVLNGTGGLVFGWLYERKGIQYAMIAHAMAHITAKLLILLYVCCR